MPQLDDYLNLLPAEHDTQPNFLATLTAILQPFVDISNVLQSAPSLYDLDVATGPQLDVIGKWVGFSRMLNVPITGVFFSFDTAGLGFDQGVIQGPGNPATAVTSLDDDTYRLMIYLQIQANHWDGSMEHAEELLAAALVSYPNTHIFIQDNLDMSMTVGITGTLPNKLFQTLLQNGYFNLRPAAVELTNVLVSPGPFFGFDIENYNISGFDVGLIT